MALGMKIKTGKVKIPKIGQPSGYGNLPDRYRMAAEKSLFRNFLPKASSFTTPTPKLDLSQFKTSGSQMMAPFRAPRIIPPGGVQLAQPSAFQFGGEVKEPGLAYVHEGERILTPEEQLNTPYLPPPENAPAREPLAGRSDLGMFQDQTIPTPTQVPGDQQATLGERQEKPEEGPTDFTAQPSAVSLGDMALAQQRNKALSDLIKTQTQMPTRAAYAPSLGRRILGMVAGGASGFAYGPQAGAFAGESVTEAPYRQAYQDWAAKMQGLEKVAGLSTAYEKAMMSGNYQLANMLLKYDPEQVRLRAEATQGAKTTPTIQDYNHYQDLLKKDPKQASDFMNLMLKQHQGTQRFGGQPLSVSNAQFLATTMGKKFVDRQGQEIDVTKLPPNMELVPVAGTNDSVWEYGTQHTAGVTADNIVQRVSVLDPKVKTQIGVSKPPTTTAKEVPTTVGGVPGFEPEFTTRTTQTGALNQPQVQPPGQIKQEPQPRGFQIALDPSITNPDVYKQIIEERRITPEGLRELTRQNPGTPANQILQDLMSDPKAGFKNESGMLPISQAVPSQVPSQVSQAQVSQAPETQAPPALRQGQFRQSAGSRDTQIARDNKYVVPASAVFPLLAGREGPDGNADPNSPYIANYAHLASDQHARDNIDPISRILREGLEHDGNKTLDLGAHITGMIAGKGGVLGVGVRGSGDTAQMIKNATGVTQKIAEQEAATINNAVANLTPEESRFITDSLALIGDATAFRAVLSSSAYKWATDSQIREMPLFGFANIKDPQDFLYKVSRFMHTGIDGLTNANINPTRWLGPDGKSKLDFWQKQADKFERIGTRQEPLPTYQPRAIIGEPLQPGATQPR